MQTRLVKITDKVTNIFFYQIQKKTLFFGWKSIDSRATGSKGTFYDYDEAIKEYECFRDNSYYNIEVIK